MKEALEKLRKELDDDIRYMKKIVIDITAGYDHEAVNRLIIWIDEKQKAYDEIFK